MMALNDVVAGVSYGDDVVCEVAGVSSIAVAMFITFLFGTSADPAPSVRREDEARHRQPIARPPNAPLPQTAAAASRAEGPIPNFAGP